MMCPAFYAFGGLASWFAGIVLLLLQDQLDIALNTFLMGGLTFAVLFVVFGRQIFADRSTLEERGRQQFMSRVHTYGLRERPSMARAGDPLNHPGTKRGSACFWVALKIVVCLSSIIGAVVGFAWAVQFGVAAFVVGGACCGGIAEFVGR